MSTSNLPDFWVFGDIEKRKANAQRVLKPVFNILGVPASFLDIGGGAGSWCAAAKDLGVQRVCLVDACPPNQVIPELSQEEQVQANLEAGIPNQGRFDLVICIEVIEHLSDDAADRLIGQMTSSTNFILFSAAIPGQGGIGHISERLHDYWHAKFSLFQFEKYDVVRPMLISSPDIASIHRQNLFLYAKKGCAHSLADLPQICEDMELIRAEHLKSLYNKEPIDLRTALGAIPNALRRSIGRRVGN
jgi:SAM-dependent methyltransferase